ncbi:hypothetical protein BJX70DRAFT_373621 [Aspergillus crustosus]
MTNSSTRKSCSFCRGKKIRCSGELICSACRSRNRNCFYTSRSSRARSSRFNLDLNHSTLPITPTDTSLGELLEGHFEQLYQHSDPSPLAAQEINAPLSTSEINYKDLFFSLTPALLSLLSTQIGQSHSIPQHNYYLQNSFARDASHAFYPKGVGETKVPLPRGDDQTARQIIELWFGQHPLSLIISKTTFLDDLQGGRLDPGLLAMILADVTPALRPTGWASAEALRAFACEQVRKRPIAVVSVSTVQLLVLLGWHQLCSGQPRRGICHINLAHKLIGQWQKQDYHRNTQRLNGVDYTAVTHELGQRIFWLTLAINLWAALQLDVPFECPAKLELSQGSPSSDITASSVYQLDQNSGNVASLAAQDVYWRAFWPLVHICQTVGPTCALLRPVSPEINVPNPSSHIFSLCQMAQTTLNGQLKSPTQLGACPSEIITHVAYQVLNIHLLCPQPGALNISLLEDIMYTLTRFINSLQVVEQSLNPPDILHGASPCSTAGVILVGMDASSRVLREITHSFDDDPDAQSWILLQQPKLEVLAQQLYSVCKHPLLRGCGALREVKVQMKLVKRRIEGLADATNIFPVAIDDPAGFYQCEGVVDPSLLDLEPLEIFGPDMGASQLLGLREL